MYTLYTFLKNDTWISEFRTKKGHFETAMLNEEA